MILKFEKYHGAGNDFIIINAQDLNMALEPKQIELLCDRRFGIGADGLMIIKNSEMSDFEMQYFNSDGFEGTMCGNGGRCISHYAHRHGFSSAKMTFLAIDGIHHAEIIGETISLGMNNVSLIQEFKDGLFMDTGSPHFVKFVNDIDSVDVVSEGLKLANDSRFAPERTNVNFVEFDENLSKIATFERGVEEETLACGTGTIAAAISINLKKSPNKKSIDLLAKGGKLNVSFNVTGTDYSDIVLSGPAKFVFSGEIEL